MNNNKPKTQCIIHLGEKINLFNQYCNHLDHLVDLTDGSTAIPWHDDDAKQLLLYKVTKDNVVRHMLNTFKTSQQHVALPSLNIGSYSSPQLRLSHQQMDVISMHRGDVILKEPSEKASMSSRIQWNPMYNIKAESHFDTVKVGNDVSISMKSKVKDLNWHPTGLLLAIVSSNEIKVIEWRDMAMEQEYKCNEYYVEGDSMTYSAVRWCGVADGLFIVATEQYLYVKEVMASMPAIKSSGGNNSNTIGSGDISSLDDIIKPNFNIIDEQPTLVTRSNKQNVISSLFMVDPMSSSSLSTSSFSNMVQDNNNNDNAPSRIHLFQHPSTSPTPINSCSTPRYKVVDLMAYDKQTDNNNIRIKGTHFDGHGRLFVLHCRKPTSSQPLIGISPNPKSLYSDVDILVFDLSQDMTNTGASVKNKQVGASDVGVGGDVNDNALLLQIMESMASIHTKLDLQSQRLDRIEKQISAPKQ
ncbi:hypothetical protein SAMD00019534_064570 [Acytostelium subglobosum LB1]|uniref:hypothetical protein n=1 Tax=Acytostelium subglobosum LB1 TaxID=1410327 RepID=UPI000644AFD1|nr:hypothetical protein SAMD00019534_064570 [Acytostelium subglobosum LB1]GAM23282.1 hypothetical protein SAMD00019534_064570 [Acytostelium subglobosum LB1]|eukprot:XP_012753731.1 hypothetical protein SAMD00019534_064570 [Acytostelium subglobosum LB1]